MRREVYETESGQFLRLEEAEPQCGEDFCDECGDCLACYEGDPCVHSENGEHRWIAYEPKYQPHGSPTT